MTTDSHIRSAPGLGHLHGPRLGPRPGFSHQKFSATLWCGTSSAGAFAWLGLGCTEEVAWNPETIKVDLCPSYQVQVNEQMLLTREIYASHSPPGPLTSQGGSSPPPRTRELGTQSVVLNTHSPGWVSSWVFALFLWVSSQGHRSPSHHFSSLSIQLHVYLSYSLGCKTKTVSYVLSPSFQFVYSVNCSTGRYNFNMFMWGGDLHLLLWHLDQPFLKNPHLKKNPLKDPPSRG